MSLPFSESEKIITELMSRLEKYVNGVDWDRIKDPSELLRIYFQVIAAAKIIDDELQNVSPEFYKKYSMEIQLLTRRVSEIGKRFRK